MAPSIPSCELDRAALEAANRRALSEARNKTKAIVSLVEWPAAPNRVVVKDLKPRALWFRLLAGRWLLAREWKALVFMGGIEGVPAPVARVDADAFAMSHCLGESFLGFAPGELSSGAVSELERLVEQMHARGVTHGDLHRDNILLDEEGRVCVIDWATACVFGPSRLGLKAWTWREWQALDLRALAKIKARYAPELLRPDEQLRLQNGDSWPTRYVRCVGALFKKRPFYAARRGASQDKGGVSQHI